MSEEDFTYFQQIAQQALMSGDANMECYAQSLQRHLNKRIGLVSGKRIAEVDQMILNDARQIERWRTSTPKPVRLAELVQKRIGRPG